MKLLTTALVLDKLGPGFRFRTTVETHGAIAQGVLSGDLILVGRGDPNLSNRKFPFGRERGVRRAAGKSPDRAGGPGGGAPG